MKKYTPIPSSKSLSSSSSQRQTSTSTGGVDSTILSPYIFRTSTATTTINSTLKSSEGNANDPHPMVFMDAITFRQTNLLDHSWPSEICEPHSFRNHLNAGNTPILAPILVSGKKVFLRANLL